MEPYVINFPSDLLNGAAIAKLSPAELVAYDAAASAFVKAFNEANPNGVLVKASINKLKMTDAGVIFVIEKQQNLSSESYTFPFVVVDAMGADLGVGNADGLSALTHSTLEKNLLVSTVKAVAKGEKFTDKDGKEHIYKQAQMVQIAGTRQEVVLSTDSKAIVGEMQQELLKESLREVNKSRRNARNTRTSRVPAPGGSATETEDEADV